MRRDARDGRRLLTGALLTALLTTPGTALAAQAQPQGKPELDVRKQDVAKVPQRTQSARDAFDRRAGGAAVDVDRTGGAIRSLAPDRRAAERPRKRRRRRASR